MRLLVLGQQALLPLSRTDCWEPPFGEEQGRLTQDTITVKEDESETYPKGMPSPLRDPNSEGRDSPNHIRVRVPHGGAGEYEYE
jgi:hypothetical protein